MITNLSLLFSQALFDVDEVYTLEERIEQQEIKDESHETKKKKKKKKKAISLVVNITPGETIDSTIAEKKSTLLVPSNEVLNTPSKKTYCEEGIVNVKTDSRGLHPVSAASECDSQSNTEFLPSNDVEQKFLHCTVLVGGNNSEGSSEGFTVCDHSMDTRDEESSVPSAKALSVALQTAILPFVHAAGSLFTEDKTNDAGKYNPKQYKDTGDSNVNNELVLDDYDSRTMELESLELIGTSTSGHSKGFRETNASVADLDLLDREVTTQTQQCGFEEKNEQEAVNEKTLLSQTDGENNDVIHEVRNSNDLGVSPFITKEQHFVISVDAHESDFTASEDGCISVDTNNAVNTILEHKTAEFSEDVKENSVISVDDSRLVNENNGIRHKDQQKQLQNGREHNEQNERSVETDKDSPLIELELGESESCHNDQSQNNDEYVPCSKEIDKGVCDTSLSGEEVIHGVSSLFDGKAVFLKSNESFGIKDVPEKEEKNEGSSHVKIKCEYNEGDLALHVFGMRQLQSEIMKSTVDTVAESMGVTTSVRNKTSAMQHASTQIETVSQLELKTVEPLEAQNENYDRPTNDCDDDEALKTFQGVTLEGTKLAEREFSDSTKVDDGLADTTNSFNLQASQGSGSLQQMAETYPTLSANADATRNKTIETDFQSFSSSSSMELQTDSSSNSFISNIQDCRLWPNEGENDAPMALDVAVESYSNLTGVSDDADISQGLREHGGGGTQQVSLIATPSNHEVLSEEGKRLDLTCVTLEHSVFVSGKHLKVSDSLSRETGAASSDKQCSALELNSGNFLSEDEEVSLNTQLPANNRDESECRPAVSKEFEHYDEQFEQMPEKQHTRTSKTNQNVTQLSETEVSRDNSVQNKDGKPDDVTLIRSLERQCSNSSPHKGRTETFASVDNERDSSLSALVNLLESGNGLKDVPGSIGFNSSSEHLATKSSVKSEGKDFSEKNRLELTSENIITEEQTNVTPRVLMTNRIDESKRKGGDDKEEGEITSDEDNTSETTKHMNKEREEGELSSSESDAEVSSYEKHRGASVPRIERSALNNSVFRRKEKELYPPRRHSLSGVPHRVSGERSKVPGNSRSDKTASLSCVKKTDLRTKLSEARQTRSSLKGRRTGVSNETKGGRLRETPAGKRVKRNSTVEKPDQGKNVRDTTKTSDKAIVESIKTRPRVSQAKRRETPQRCTGASNETNPGSSQRRDESTEISLKFVKETKGKCDNSLQGDDGKAKKTSPIISRQKIHDRCGTFQVDPNKTSKDSTVLRKTQGNRKTRKSRIDQRNGTKVMGKESMTKLDTSDIKKSRDCKGGHRKTAKDSRVLSRPKVKTNACLQVLDSQKAPPRVTKENMKIITKAKLSLNDPVKHRNASCVESSLRPHTDNETTAKKAYVQTHLKSGDKINKGGEKTGSALLSSEGKVQNKPENSSKATGERKTMDSVEKHSRHSDKGKTKRVKTPVKASARITPRKVLKKLSSNVTSKAKLQAQHAERDKAGNTRKRSRAIDISELRQAKKLRLEGGNDFSSKVAVDASTTEKPSTKCGEYNNRENRLSSLKLRPSEQDVIPPGGEKLKTVDGEICMDDPKTSSYNRTLSKTLSIGGNKRLVFKQRHVNQLFIRGDNVVMVAYAK